MATAFCPATYADAARASATTVCSETVASSCRRLPHDTGVVAIPCPVFYDDPSVAPTLVRFACCKRPEVLAEAVDRLHRLRR